MKKELLIVMLITLLLLLSCNSENKKVTIDNQGNESIEITLKSLTQEEYDQWVAPNYDGIFGPDGKHYHLPKITDFDYPCVKGLDNKELQDKINETIKDAIFNEEFFSDAMAGVFIVIMPWSEFDFPGIIYRDHILSIPITIYWCREKEYYKTTSVTIDMKTGERLFLEDIIELNEAFAKKMVYEVNFLNDETGEMSEYLYHYLDADKKTPDEVIENLLDILNGYAPEDQKPQIEYFYLRKDGIVLTHFAHGNPLEINISLENLQDYLKIESWKANDRLEPGNSIKFDLDYYMECKSYAIAPSVLTNNDMPRPEENNEWIKSLSICYPQLYNMEDFAREQRINDILFKEALNIHDIFSNRNYIEYDVDYAVMEATDNIISILYTGFVHSPQRANRFAYGVTIDLNEERIMDLSEFYKIDENFVEKHLHKDFKVYDNHFDHLDDNNSYVQDYVNNYGRNTHEHDFYIMNGYLGLIIPAPQAMGYILIEGRYQD